MQNIEEQLAHMTKTVDELSDVIARQDGEIRMLARRVQMLMQREAEREAAAGSHIYTGDERPPHY